MSVIYILLHHLTVLLWFQRRQESSSSDVSTPDWEWQHQMFLVCVYNVSVDQPYTILQVPMSSTAQDVCMQVCVNTYTHIHAHTILDEQHVYCVQTHPVGSTSFLEVLELPLPKSTNHGNVLHNFYMFIFIYY